MPIFWKGAAAGSHWHGNNARTAGGFSARQPGNQATPDAVMRHIVHGNTHTPLISLTKSFGVAEAYARPGGAPRGYVYEIQLTSPLPSGVTLLDPVAFISDQVKDPLMAPSYHHDGDQDFLLSVVSQSVFWPPKPARRPPGSARIQNSPNLTIELQAIVFALRDAEILATGTLPSQCIIARHIV